MGIKMNITKTRQDLDKIDKKIQRNIKVAGEQQAGEVFRETKVLVPKDTRALVNSGSLTRSFAKTKLTWTIKYGDSNVDGIGVYYAAAVHEVKAKHTPPTTMKYVETPLVKSVADWHSTIARAVRKAVR